MTHQTLILLFLNDRAYLTPEISFSLEELGLHHLAQQKIEEPVGWALRIRRFFPEDGRLSVEVLRYELEEPEFPEEQLTMDQELERVTRLYFRGIDTNKALLSLNQESAVKKALYHTQENDYSPSLPPIPPPTEEEPAEETTAPKSQQVDRTIKVHFANVTFVDGGAQWTAKLPSLRTPQTFLIENLHLRAEHDAAKRHYAEVLGTGLLKIRIQGTLIDGQLELESISSPELAQIEADTLEQVRLAAFQELVTPAKNTDGPAKAAKIFDRSSLTAELNQEAALFTEDDLIGQLLMLQQTLHYPQLRYLAQRPDCVHGELLFVTEPVSFVFTVLPTPHQQPVAFFVWETINTKEATYIWRVQVASRTELPAQRRKIQHKIAHVLDIGKSHYLRLEEPHFCRVWHEYDQENPRAGFERWRKQVERIVVG